MNPTAPGAGGGIRTRDLLLTRQLLYLLSYASKILPEVASPTPRDAAEDGSALIEWSGVF